MMNPTAMAMSGFSAASPANSNLTFYVVGYELRYDRHLVALNYRIESAVGGGQIMEGGVHRFVLPVANAAAHLSVYIHVEHLTTPGADQQLPERLLPNVAVSEVRVGVNSYLRAGEDISALVYAGLKLLRPA